VKRLAQQSNREIAELFQANIRPAMPGRVAGLPVGESFWGLHMADQSSTSRAIVRSRVMPARVRV
jgi:hypothetical protein